MKDSFISFVDYHFKYFMREFPALSNIDLSIAEGEFVVITGSSGSGKSTLIYSILGLIPFFYSGEIKGEVLFKGENISNIQLANHSRTVGYISQRIDNSFATPFVFSELAFPLEYANKGNKCDIGTKVNNHSLNLNINNVLTRRIHSLSEGEKQLVSFGCASINNCDVLIADEPLANLDNKNRKLILSKFKKIHNVGKTLIITTHDYKSYLPFASRLIHVIEGEIKEDKRLNRKDKTSIVFDYEDNFTGLRGSQSVLKHDNISIDVTNLKFRFSEQFQLEDISFTAEKGKVIGIIGDNGSGKTTLLKNLIGLLEPQSGTINILGKSIKNLSWNELTERVGVVFQNPDKQFFETTVKNEILLISKNLQRKIEEEGVSNKLKECGLEGYENYNPHSLSFGEKRRIAFLAATHHQPEIILIDEITIGMDNQNKNWLQNRIRKLRDLEKTIIIISHDWNWLGKIVDEIIHLRNGQISFIIDAKQFNSKILVNAEDITSKEEKEK